MTSNQPRAKAPAQQSPQQVTLALDPPPNLPHPACRQCLTVLAEMLKTLIRHEQNENAHER